MEEKAQEVQQDHQNARSEYSQKVEELTLELMELAAQQQGKARTGLIVISVNEPEGSEKSENIISITGDKTALLKGICNFARQKETGELFHEAVEIMTMVSLKNILRVGR